MRQPEFMQMHQLEVFAPFLEEHPGFSPLLIGEDAQVCGFQIGGSYVSVGELERIVGARPQFDPKQVALLLAPAGAPGRRR